MLAAREYRTSFDAMDLRRIIPSDITASAIAHVSLLTLLVLFSEVHPFGAVTAEQIPVEIVTPQELAEKQAPPDEPPAENKPAETEPATPSPISPCSTSLRRPRRLRRRHRLRLPRGRRSRLRSPRRPRPSRRRSQQVAPPPSQPAAPAYKPPEPDVSIKYQVLLGLPPDLAPCRRLRRRSATRPTTISMRRRPRRPISRTLRSRNFGGT